MTDNPPEDVRFTIRKKLGEGEAQLLFSSDGKEIEDKLKSVRPELILGSSLERQIAEELNVPLVEISAPVYDKVYLQQALTGYDGGIRLIEDFSAEILKYKTK
jgi:nitrogenase molybdenum-iron protein beta chain